MDIGWPEITIIAIVILVLFGSKKLPDAARSLGRSARILKTELKDLHGEDDDDKTTPVQTAQLPVAPPAAVVPDATAEPVRTGDQTAAS